MQNKINVNIPDLNEYSTIHDELIVAEMPSDTDILNSSALNDKDDFGDENLESDSVANSVSTWKKFILEELPNSSETEDMRKIRYILPNFTVK